MVAGGAARLRAVIAHQLRGLVVVDLQALAYGFFPVVLALHELLAGVVVTVGRAWRIVRHVIDAPGAWVHAAPGETVDDHAVGHVDFNHMVDRHAGVAQCVCLRDGPREAVEQETAGAVGARDALLDERDDELIRDELPAGHHLAHFQPQFGAFLDGGTEHIARRHLRDAEVLHDELGLGAFPGTGSPQENDAHELSPKLRRACAMTPRCAGTRTGIVMTRALHTRAGLNKLTALGA